MKTIGKYVLWFLGIFTWIIFFMLFLIGDSNNGTSVHTYILIITGICLALYIWRKTDSGAKKLEQKVQELEKENRQLREQAGQKFVQDIIDRTSGK